MNFLTLFKDRRKNISLRQRWRQYQQSLELAKADNERIWALRDEDIEQEIRNAQPGGVIYVYEGWLERTAKKGLEDKTGSRPAKPLGSVPNAREHWLARPFFLLFLLVACVAFWAGVVLLIGWLAEGAR